MIRSQHMEKPGRAIEPIIEIDAWVHWVPVATHRETLMPERFAILAGDPGVRILVAIIDGRPRCVGITPEAPNELITTADLRSLALQRIIRTTIATYGAQAWAFEDGSIRVGDQHRESDQLHAYRDQIEVALRSEEARKRERNQTGDRKNAITLLHLARVAKVRAEAPKFGKQAVAKHFQTTVPSAGRWIGKARGKGLLDENDQITEKCGGLLRAHGIDPGQSLPPARGEGRRRDTRRSTEPTVTRGEAPPFARA